MQAEELVSSSLASLAESRLITGPANPITKFQQVIHYSLPLFFIRTTKSEQLAYSCSLNVIIEKSFVVV